MNGKAAEYNESEPLVNTDYPKNIDNVLPEKTNGLLEKIGVKAIVSNFFDVFAQVLHLLTRIIYR